MRITRLFLRNYRVYEEPLELEVPPGLVGIFGVNGSGKSLLLESILFALYGYTRTSKDDVRTTGVNGDCIVEVQFEHEGHLYDVRRTISGVNSTVKAQATVDGAQVAEGVRDTGHYMHSVLGMDSVAFRSSVFAEQKQLAAFSGKTAAERQKLVLKLLGITPLDGARDAARKDARETQHQLDRLRTMLPDLDELRAAVEAAQATAVARASEAAEAEEVATTRAAARDEAARAFEQLDDVRREHDDLVKQGVAVRKEQDDLSGRVQKHEAELAGLREAAERLAELEPDAAGLDEAEVRLQLVGAAVAAAARVDALAVPTEPPAADEEGAEAARVLAEEAGARVAGVEAELALAVHEVDRARQAVARSGELSDEADCPLCGQALGDAFASVQAHRAAELAEREARVKELDAARTTAVATAGDARDRAANLARAVKGAREARAKWQAACAGRAEAEAALAASIELLGRAPQPGEPDALAADVARRKQAAEECTRLRARLERRPRLEADLEAERARLADAADRRQTLLEKVKGLAFDKDVLAAAETARAQAVQAADTARRAAEEVKVAAATAAAAAEGDAKRLADAEAQHVRLAATAEEARHLGRLAELLSSFRNGVVATVGPRLAAQAADLFAELTDHEYDRLEVDPDTYELQIRDAGVLHGLGRFSGSETDLANLALRVAISEHVRFQAGGAVGLLVLDEIFGPLDDDRRERMLLALERLKGRFRQVLVVTHASELKEQLPSAIEVVKLPGRRATARAVGRA